jgi:hypothetical protein
MLEEKGLLEISLSNDCSCRSKGISLSLILFHLQLTSHPSEDWRERMEKVRCATDTDACPSRWLNYSLDNVICIFDNLVTFDLTSKK